MKKNFLDKSVMQRGVAAMLFACASMSTQALTFDSGSDGSDGALDFSWAVPASGRVTVILDPNDASTFDPSNPSRVLDADNDNIFHFTSVTIPDRVTVKLTAKKLNWAPVYWLSSGDITINQGGYLSLRGESGHSAASTGEGHFPALPGPGGYPGGLGASAMNAAQPGFGPGGGSTASGDGAGGAGSYSFLGEAGNGSSGVLYGSPFLLPLVGGSGGAGGGNGSVPQSASRWGGGAGGGAIVLASSSQIIVDGAISAKGGDGGGEYYTYGAAGSGGAIRLLTPVFKGRTYYQYSDYTGWISANGGDGNISGGGGRIRIETFDNQFEGRFFPDNTNSIRISGLVPSTPFLPTDNRVPGWPSVHVTTINSVAVSIEPTGSFYVPDATVSVITAVPVVFEAKNVPITANLKLHIYGPDFAPMVISPTLSSGSDALSTWAADVAFPVGVSRAYLQATWTP